jgi:alpha-beta hydrolase superfamily lysophospholipase
MSTHETYSSTFETHDNLNLFYRQWSPGEDRTTKPRAVLTAVHGGMSECGDWDEPARYFQKLGIATYALDLRGHGRSPEFNPGQKLLLDIESFDQYREDYLAFLHLVSSENPGIPIYYLGHSMGGLIGLTVGLEANLSNSWLRGFILSAPGIKVRGLASAAMRGFVNIMATVAPRMPIAGGVRPDQLTRDPDVRRRIEEDNRLKRRGSKLTPRAARAMIRAGDRTAASLASWPAIPLLVIHAGRDPLVDVDFGRKALAAVPEHLLTQKLYPDNYHENFNEVNRTDIYRLVGDWISERDT